MVTDEPGFEVDGAVRLPDEGDGDLNRALHHASLRVRLLDPDPRRGRDVRRPALPDARTTWPPRWTPGWLPAGSSPTPPEAVRRCWRPAPGMELDPHFGDHSAYRHEQSGATPGRVDVPTLRQDVDTEADLAAARQLGVGAHTTSAPGAEHLRCNAGFMSLSCSCRDRPQ